MKVGAVMVISCLLLAGCFGGEEKEDETDDPSDPIITEGNGDPTFQDPETGEARAIPPRDDSDRPTDTALSSSGRWMDPFEGDIPAISLSVLPDRRILYWNGTEEGDAGPGHWSAGNYPLLSARSRVLDLSGDAPAIVEPEYFFDVDTEDIFCSGLAMLPDGRIISAGGGYWWRDGDDPTRIGGTGLTSARIFHPHNDTWTNVGELALGRWYPTVFPTPDGNAMIASGIGFIADPQTHWANFEQYLVDDAEWGAMPGTDGHNLPLYPQMRVLPGGDLAGHAFYPASGTMWGPFGEHPDQEDWRYFQSHDLETDTWHTHGEAEYGARGYASTVMLPGDPTQDYKPTIISFGGTLYQSTVATDFTEIIDASTDPPTTRAGPSLHEARWHHQTVTLPTGEPMTIGGGLIDSVITWGPTNEAVMSSEMWDADNQQWILLPEMQVERMYHSTAAVLPDGRVLVGGHVPNTAPTEVERELLRPPIVETRFEIYEPGYLFRGERPVILSAPTDVDFGETFFVELEGNVSVDSVMLQRLTTTTHAFDSSGRSTWLEVVDTVEGGVMVRAPPSGIVTPPGPHMLFVNGAHEEGPIPSVAAMVFVGVDREPTGTTVVQV